MFERAAAGAGGVTAHVGEVRGRWRRGHGSGHGGNPVQLKIGVETVAFHFGKGAFAERRALRFDEFGNFHGRFQADGRGGFLVAQQLSKSVDRQAGEIAQFVEHSFGPVMTGFEEGASEGGVLPGPVMDGGPVDAHGFGGGGNGLPGDEGLEDVLLHSVEGARN